ncbi:hypothetical protein ACXJJ3_38885 [Kribbella sp. WER1]
MRWGHLLGELSVEKRDLEVAEAAVARAVEYVQGLYPGLRVTPTVFPGGAVAALVHEARESALVVVGRGHRFERSLARRLERRTTAALAVVGAPRDGSAGTSGDRLRWAPWGRTIESSVAGGGRPKY